MDGIVGVGAYAQHRGVSRRAVYNAIETGRLLKALNKDEQGRIRIDVEVADREWEANTGRLRAGEPVRPAPLTPRKAKTENNGAPEDLGTGGTADSEPLAYLPPLPKRGKKSCLTLLEAQTAKAEAEAHLKRLQVRRLEGKLGSKDRYNAAVFRLARNERDAWLSWPARVDGLVTAEINAIIAKNGTITQRELNLILDRHVRQHLVELGTIDPDAFLRLFDDEEAEMESDGLPGGR